MVATDERTRAQHRDYMRRYRARPGKAEANAASSLRWHYANRERHLEALRWQARGIAPVEYAALHEAQAGLCAVCHQPERTRTRNADHANGPGNPRHLAADHCHRTGKRRALLCSQCNRALGLMGDDPARLRAAADYLEAWAD